MRTLILLLTVAFALTCGCSGKPYQPKQTAESIAGTVTFNDKAVANAELHFSDVSRKISAAVKTDAEGKFTVAPSDLPVGKYSTYITPANPKDIPPKYQTPIDTPLALEIKEGSNDLKVVLEK
jgi:hypothetical protein